MDEAYTSFVGKDASMTVPSLDQARQQLQAAEDEQAFWDAHFDELVRSYRDQFVVAKDGEIIAAADDLVELVELLSAQNVDIAETWVRFVREDHSKLLL